MSGEMVSTVSSSLRLASAVGCALGVTTAQRIAPHLHDIATFESAPRELVETAEDANPHAESDEAAVDDLVTDKMPGLTDKIDLVHHAGRISLDKSKRNNIFYWHFAAATNAETAPLLIWLNGGPGCTSMQGLFLGVSPFQIEDEATLSINKHSWHHHANILFIDQPVGTGMSLTRGNDLRKDEETVAKDFYTVLTQFFQRHPEYLSAKSASGIRTSRDLYMFGESHAGRFIPQFSAHIMTQNDLLANTKDGGIHISLQGVGIGNGWVHPFIQYDYSDYAHGLGLITFGQVRALKTAYAECQNALASGNFLTAPCFENMNSILDGVRNTRASGGKSLNYYDAREYVRNVKAYPPQRTFIRDYMNQMQVRELLHANTDPSFRFKGCSDDVYDELRLFDGVSTLAEVGRMLQSGVRVLFYNGQWDMMCNHYGTEKLLLHLDWNGSTLYQEAKKYMWTTPGRNEPAGFAQEGGNLSYVVIANAGHMVPLDVPDVAVEMVRRFINSERFDDAAQPVKSFATNRTNYETTQCLAGIPATPVGVKGNGVSLTWFWIAVVVAVVGSLLVCCVSMLCRRSRTKARHSEHSVVIQESDDEEEEDEERMEKEDGESDEELTEVAIRSRG